MTSSFPRVLGVLGLAVLVVVLVLLLVRTPSATGPGPATPETPGAGATSGTTVAASAFRVSEPERVLSSREIVPGEPVTITLREVPAGATAVGLYVTGARNTSPSSLVVCAGTEVTEACADFELVRVEPDRPAGALTFLELDPEAPFAVTFAASQPMTVFADRIGHMVYGTAPDDALHVAVPTSRAAQDLRIEARTARTIALAGVPAGATAAVVTLTSTATPESTYVAACPADQDPSECARTSMLNPVEGEDRQATTVVGLSGLAGNEIQVYSNGDAGALSVDVRGYFVSRAAEPETGGSWHPVGAQATTEEVTARAKEPTVLSLPASPSGATAALVRLSASGAWRPTPLVLCPGVSPSEACAARRLVSTGSDGRATTTVLIALDPGNPEQVVLTSPDASVSVGTQVLGYFAPPVAGPEPANLAPEELDRPGPSTTGVPAGTSLTRHEGDLVITEPDTEIDGLDIHGFVDVRAPGVVIRNSVIRGREATQGTGLLTNTSGHEVVIEDSELFAGEPSGWVDGIRGGDVTARRLDIHDVIDAVHIYGDNVTIEDSWLHDNLHYEEDPAQGGSPSHDDSIQIQRGSNIDILRNDISGANNTGIQFTQDQGQVSDVRIIGNWLDGGGCSVNLSEKGRGPFQEVVIADNVFGLDTRHAECAIIAPETTEIESSGNVFVDGEPVEVRPG